MNNALFYATDMDIYDALYSAKLRITNSLLVEMLRARGIIVQENADRDELIEYMSSLPHDYHDFTYLMDCVSSSARSEKISSTSLGEGVIKEEVEHAFTETKTTRSDKNETYSISKVNGKYIIDVQYTEIDHSKTRLRQRTHKEAKIEIEVNNGKTQIRHPANERVHDIVDTIVKKIEQKKDHKVERQDISFAGIPSHKSRSNFFTKLISNIHEFKPLDVTKINVNQIDTEPPSEEDLEASDNKFSEVEAELVGIVEKAMLKGESLLSSREFQELSQYGFFISSIRWTAEKVTSPQIKLEFEAQFHNPTNCTQFRYNVLGAYTALEQGYTKHRKPLKDHEKTPYLKLIEDTAQRIYSDILAENFDE